MIKIILFLFLISLITFACDTKDEELILRERISNFEDSITALSYNLGAGERLSPELSHDLIELLLRYYHTYPDDVHAPEYLDKVHLTYSAMGNYFLAAKYADTILLNYKDYINRNFILESQVSTYDIFLKPRDTSKVRYYNELLLQENVELSTEKKEDIEFRLKNLHLTLDEIVGMQIDR
jgi:hypothetical protein